MYGAEGITLTALSERESPSPLGMGSWDESEVGYGVPLKIARFVVL
ncbi:hypothetical protein [Bacillus mycoides]|nr:hypothetical protein [Bacillus mycoides]